MEKCFQFGCRAVTAKKLLYMAMTGRSYQCIFIVIIIVITFIGRSIALHIHLYRASELRNKTKIEGFLKLDLCHKS